MRLSQLLASEVVDREGGSAGTVRDVRVVVRGDGVEAVEVQGLIVGRGAVGERFGYAYGHVQGPAILARPMSRLARRARYVDWDDVVALEADRIVIAGSVDGLPHAIPAEDQP